MALLLGVIGPIVTQRALIWANETLDTTAQLQRIRNTLVHAGDTLNVGVCGGGTHPFQKWSERKIFSKPRFKEK